MAWLGRGKAKTSETHLDKLLPLRSRSSSDVERRAVEIGRELLQAAREYSTSVLSARFWNDQLMNWAMKDPGLQDAIVPLHRRLPHAPHARAGA